MNPYERIIHFFGSIPVIMGVLGFDLLSTVGDALSTYIGLSDPNRVYQEQTTEVIQFVHSFGVGPGLVLHKLAYHLLVVAAGIALWGVLCIVRRVRGLPRPDRAERQVYVGVATLFLLGLGFVQFGAFVHNLFVFYNHAG
jgi:hypothetical protein